MITSEDIISMTQYAGAGVVIAMAAWGIFQILPALALSVVNLFMWMALPTLACFMAWYYIVGAGSEDYIMVDNSFLNLGTYKGLTKCRNCMKFDIIDLAKGNLIHDEPCRFCGCMSLEGIER